MRNRRYYRGQLPNSSPGEYTASAKLAERVGFEPTIRKAGFWPLQRLFAQK